MDRLLFLSAIFSIFASNAQAMLICNSFKYAPSGALRVKYHDHLSQVQNRRDLFKAKKESKALKISSVKLVGHEGPICFATFSEDASLVMTGSSDQSVKFGILRRLI